MRILIVGMADSVHLSRWLQQFAQSDHQFEVVSSSPHRSLHPILAELLNQNPRFNMSGVSRYFSLFLWLGDRFASDWLRGSLIAVTSHFFRPDVVHVCEFQNAGYSYLRSRSLSRRIKEAQLILTPYGSDIYWFKRFPKHRAKLKNLLGHADLLSAECERDRTLASSLGFRGSFGPLIPASGEIVAVKASQEALPRNTIAVKGYQNKWGRAKNALRAIAMNPDLFRGYRIEVFSCNHSTLRAGKRLIRDQNLDLVLHPKGSLSHQEMQNLFQRSRVYIALSRSDGLPSSLLEAMACGAVPVQSSTACIPRWLVSGENGFFVHFDDLTEISDSLRKLMLDETMCELMAERNKSLLIANFGAERVSEAVRATYVRLGSPPTPREANFRTSEGESR